MSKQSNYDKLLENFNQLKIEHEKMMFDFADLNRNFNDLKEENYQLKLQQLSKEGNSDGNKISDVSLEELELLREMCDHYQISNMETTE